jgi:hypothetical protein
MRTEAADHPDQALVLSFPAGHQSSSQLERPSPVACLLQDALDKLAPEGNHYRHLDEGYDDMPAHVKVCRQTG